MTFTKLTPNLIVRDVAASQQFYCDVLGFERGFNVPEQAPFVFGSVSRDGIEVFFNEAETVAKEFPAFAGRDPGGTLTLYIEVSDVDGLHAAITKHKVKVVAPLHTQFYGMREFTMADPDGWLLTFAQRVG